MSAIRSHSLSVGIVGLPNSGKSTLFNSLTKNTVPAENFPFTTIDKNIGVVQIPDSRLDRLELFFHSKKRVPSAMTFVDIAGLVKGASKGEGLGNQFLSHIREVDVIMYVLRAFNSEKIVHVYDRVDPVEDLEIVQAELILKDIETVEKRLNEVSRIAKTGDEKALMETSLYERLLKWLGEGKPVIEFLRNAKEEEAVHDLWLLTDKKMMYVLNVREGSDQADIQNWQSKLEEFIPDESRDYVVKADVKLIGELSEMDDATRGEYLGMFESKPNDLEDIIKVAYNRLNLITFYTGSEKEVNSWTIEKGATAKEAAGVIHTDLGNTFITADVINVDKMIDLGGWNTSKESGEVKNHGKEYLMEDGDYLVVYSNG